MSRTLRLLAVATLAVPLLAIASPPRDDFDAGFAVFNEAALTQGFALPEIGSARVLAPGQWQQRLALDWTNEFVTESAADGETLIEDGETQRYGLGLRRGLAGGFELGLELPVYLTGGGVLDGPIQSWHDFFGLPNGGRQFAPDNRILYRYQAAGRTRLNVDSSHAGIGDVRLTGGWQAAPQLALRALVKLPTGQTSHLTGGNAGGALWLDYEPMLNPRSRWYSFLSAGGSYSGGDQPLGDQARRWAALAGAGLGYHVVAGLALQAQLYYHSPLYRHSRLDALHRSGLQLAVGGRYTFSAHAAFEAGFQEDPVTNSSPDFSIHLALVLR
ncbi:MAG: DUF3187 family protein [Gammaproteobacteria bacterium]|nr:DUF3187 family protein [Gammaproteobacteria bacterium]